MGIDTCCCFTGHRPDKVDKYKEIIIKRLDKEIEFMINKGFTTFISGMAPGTDTWAAERVIGFKRENDNVKLVCALPYPGFCKGRCVDIMRNADIVKNISSRYYTGVFQVRNEWMVNHSSAVIAVYNGTSGGTKNTVDYARKRNVPVLNILKPDTLSLFL